MKIKDADTKRALAFRYYLPDFTVWFITEGLRTNGMESSNPSAGFIFRAFSVVKNFPLPPPVPKIIMNSRRVSTGKQTNLRHQ